MWNFGMEPKWVRNGIGLSNNYEATPISRLSFYSLAAYILPGADLGGGAPGARAPPFRSSNYIFMLRNRTV